MLFAAVLRAGGVDHRLGGREVDAAMGALHHGLDIAVATTAKARGLGTRHPRLGLGGGGYNPTTVPRMWALACAELFDVTLPDETPETFSYHASIPTLTDHDEPPVAPHDLETARQHNRQTIEEVKETLFGYYS